MKMAMTNNFYLLLFDFYQKFADSPYLKFFVVFVLFFFLVLLLSLVRKHIFQISARGALFGFVVGIILMIFLDLIIIFSLGDKTKIQKLFSEERKAEHFREVIISGMDNLSRVLGVSTITTPQKPKTAQEIILEIMALPDAEAKQIKKIVCPLR
jgi:hypothetical protein